MQGSSVTSNLLSKYTIKQHPAGDRYSLIPLAARGGPGVLAFPRAGAASAAAGGGGGAGPSRTAMPSPTTSGYGDGARSVCSTPGAAPGGGGQRAGPDDLDRLEFARYLSSWRHLATSKTEQDASTILIPELDRPAVAQLLGRTPGPGQGPSAGGGGDMAGGRRSLLSMKERRLRQVERMRKAWGLGGVIDSSANIHNQLSAEDFLQGGGGRGEPLPMPLPSPVAGGGGAGLRPPPSASASPAGLHPSSLCVHVCEESDSE